MAECLIAMPAQLMGQAICSNTINGSYTYTQSWSYSDNTNSQTGYATVCTVNCAGAMNCKLYLPSITISGTGSCTKSALTSYIGQVHYKVVNGDESFISSQKSSSTSKTGSIGACSFTIPEFSVQFTPQGDTFAIQIYVYCNIESSDSSGTKRTTFECTNQTGMYTLTTVVI